MGLYGLSVNNYDKKMKEIAKFKSDIISYLNEIKIDCMKRETKIKKLQNAMNVATQEKKKILKDKDKVIKQKENENKTLRTKTNESRAEIARCKQSVDKIKRENELENDKKSLSEKLAKQIKLVEIERKEKLSVSDKNQ